MKTLILSLLLVQVQGPFQVVNQGGNVYLIPQGIIKMGPRSWSAFDPSNPYREQPASVIATPTQPQPRQRVFLNLQPQSGKPVVLLNPFAK